MKKLWILVLLLIAACSPEITVFDAVMTLQTEPNPAAVGESTLVITLHDTNGMPIDNATLVIDANMDHAGMEPVKREINGGSAGVYRVPFEWTMGGGWVVNVTAKLPDKTTSQTFDLFVDAMSSDSVVKHK
jgi:hypothetical protein